MGLNSEHAMRICFDIETAPLPEAADYLVEPIEAPSNYKDVSKISAYIADAKAAQLAKCSLDPDLCQIVAVSCLAEDGAELVGTLDDTSSERDLLQAFWNEVWDRHLVGFNCGSFDIPVLLRRSLYLGVTTPAITVDRYRHPHYTDLLSVLSFNGLQRMHSLSFYAKRFGCDIPDVMDGSGIALAVAEGRWDDIETHVQADVRKTAFIAQKCGYFTPVTAEVF